MRAAIRPPCPTCRTMPAGGAALAARLGACLRACLRARLRACLHAAAMAAALAGAVPGALAGAAAIGLGLGLVPPSPAHAQATAVPTADARAIRETIEQQLEAFAADDGERAFSHASPAVRERFGGPELFMTMVRQGYPAVIRPRSRTWFAPEPDAGAVIQPLQLVDQAGNGWLAFYRMIQADGRWRIDAVLLKPRGPAEPGGT